MAFKLITQVANCANHRKRKGLHLPVCTYNSTTSGHRSVTLANTFSIGFFRSILVSLSPGFVLLVPWSAREKVQWILPSPAHHHAWAVQEGTPGHSLTSSLVPLQIPEKPSLSPARPSLSAALAFSGQPKVSGAGIKNQPRKANISPSLSSSGYIKLNKRLWVKGLALQWHQGWLQWPNARALWQRWTLMGSPAGAGEERRHWMNPDGL